MPVVHHYIYVLIYQTINQYLLVKMVIILWEENNRKLKQKMHKLFPVLNSRVLISWWQWMIDILFNFKVLGQSVIGSFIEGLWHTGGMN